LTTHIFLTQYNHPFNKVNTGPLKLKGGSSWFL